MVPNLPPSPKGIVGIVVAHIVPTMGPLTANACHFPTPIIYRRIAEHRRGLEMLPCVSSDGILSGITDAASV
jgi:hypothetical protein